VEHGSIMLVFILRAIDKLNTMAFNSKYYKVRPFCLLKQERWLFNYFTK